MGEIRSRIEVALRRCLDLCPSKQMAVMVEQTGPEIRKAAKE